VGEVQRCYRGYGLLDVKSKTLEPVGSAEKFLTTVRPSLLCFHTACEAGSFISKISKAFINKTEKPM
jgi:hypothetical protein